MDQSVVLLLWILYCAGAAIVLYCRMFKNKRYKKLLSTHLVGMIAAIVFFYLFFTSFVYRCYHVDTSVSFIRWQCKSVAKSAHFAMNAMTSASLEDSSGFTGDVLRWVESLDKIIVVYYFTGLMVMLAPVFSVAWILTFVDVNYINRLKMKLTKKKKFWVFYDSSELSVCLAEQLKKSIGNEESIVFCRTSAQDSDKDSNDFNRICEIADYFFREDEIKSYIRGNNNTLVMCPQNADAIKEYIDSKYQFPKYAKDVLVVSIESTDKLKEQILSIGTKQSINFHYGSYGETVAKEIIQQIDAESAITFFLGDDDTAQILQKQIEYCNLGDKKNWIAHIANHQPNEKKYTIILATDDKTNKDNAVKIVNHCVANSGKDVTLIIRADSKDYYQNDQQFIRHVSPSSIVDGIVKAVYVPDARDDTIIRATINDIIKNM